MPETPRATLVALFNDTRKRLVETGTRNRLVHVNRASARGNVVNIVNERADAVHAILHDKKAMRFLATGTDSEAAPEVDLALPASLPGPDGADPARHTDKHLETRLGPDALQKRLLKIAREAQTAEEESGANILYLALGFLTWFEDPASNLAREAPLVLLPVELVRNARTSTYDLRLRDDDVVTNLPLQQRLADDFGVTLPLIDIDEAWTPGAYCAQVAAGIAGRAGWKVDVDAIQLGFFSFAKLLMYRDLAIERWPDGAIASHPLTRGLLYEGFTPEPPLFADDTRLDDVLAPAHMFHVVDADASQARVIEEVRAGRNLVVQGPPGTGKSQTITNIIAAAVKDGKRVLFIAEKMAALSVVHNRLVQAGLRDICLELHSRSASKLAVLAELARTLGVGAANPSNPASSATAAAPGAPGAADALTAARDELNAISAALHAPIGASGATAFAVLSRQIAFMGRGLPPPTIDGAALVGLTDAQEAQAAAALVQYGVLVDGAARPDPFLGAANADLQPVDLVRLAALAAATAQALAQFGAALGAPLAALGLSLPLTLAGAARVQEVLARLAGMPDGAWATATAQAMLRAGDLARVRASVAAGAAWRRERALAEAVFIAPAFDADAAPLRGALVAGNASFLRRWGSAYRAASQQLAGWLHGPLPAAPAARVALVDRLLALAALRQRWEQDQAHAAAVLGQGWRAAQTDFAALLAVLDWAEPLAQALRQERLVCAPEALVRLAQDPALVDQLARALAQAQAGARRDVDELLRMLAIDPATFVAGGADAGEVAAMRARADAIGASTGRYSRWAQARQLRAKLGNAGAGFGVLADAIASGRMTAAAACDELAYARAEALWQSARAASPLLRGLAQEQRHALVARFGNLERARLTDNVATIRAGHLARLPQGAQGEMKILRGEIGKKRGHMALRRLFASTGDALQRIKPVLLMSPISVAQFLTPGKLAFDLLVIDEASQVRPEDALGAIARAGQIVVVGDQKQLPPSSFFDRILDDDAPDDDHDGDGNADGNADGKADGNGAGARAQLLGSAAAAGRMESILSLCEARGLGARMLRWHYRSRDPSLIAVSNSEFYDDALILPPSPLQKHPGYGLRFTRVDGVYDKGGKRDNRIEGAALVARVAEHARADARLSLGIVTFSTAQRNLITELLEGARRTDAALDAFLREGQNEDLFVKNIENVQGDERDVILISIGYGPAAPGGRLASMTFGPVNAEGGERRLNVLFTRARVRCEVFASFDPGDIEPARASRDGARILKRYLEFARDGRLTRTACPVGQADSPFEEDVAEAVRKLGYLADPQVGSAGFRIDLGVRHPERPDTYLLAIECDGATYHSALWARERDRLRQEVLENLGWTFHRIWSTDWFYNRAVEIDRLRAALDGARQGAACGIRIAGANRARAAAAVTTTAAPAAATVAPQPLAPADIPFISGPGTYTIRVVSSAAMPDGATATATAPLACRLVLLDSAVAVEVAGSVVGHLGGQHAQEFRAAVQAGDLGAYSAFGCHGRLAGTPGHALWLDLPQD